MNFTSIIAKAKNYAAKNPDKVRDGIDKAEAAVNAKTGNKYAGKVRQGRRRPRGPARGAGRSRAASGWRAAADHCGCAAEPAGHPARNAAARSRLITAHHSALDETASPDGARPG